MQTVSASDEEGELGVEEDGQLLETKRERRMRQQKEKQVRSPPRCTYRLESVQDFICQSIVGIRAPSLGQ